jgi:hypothetical protein
MFLASFHNLFLSIPPNSPHRFSSLLSQHPHYFFTLLNMFHPSPNALISTFVALLILSVIQVSLLVSGNIIFTLAAVFRDILMLLAIVLHLIVLCCFSHVLYYSGLPLSISFHFFNFCLISCHFVFVILT